MTEQDPSSEASNTQPSTSVFGQEPRCDAPVTENSLHEDSHNESTPLVAILPQVLGDDEELWLISDQVQVSKLAQPHVLVVTNRRLLTVSLNPKTSVLLNAERRELALNYTNMSEMALRRNSPGLRRADRHVVLQWKATPHEPTVLAVKGLLAGVRPPSSEERANAARNMAHTAEIARVRNLQKRNYPIASLFVGYEAISWGKPRSEDEHLFSAIASIEITGDLVAKSRVGPVVLFGIFGLGAKSTQDRTFVRIRMRDGSEASYEILQWNPAEIRAIIEPKAWAADVPWYGEKDQTFGSKPPALVADELVKLAALRDQGVLSDAEFEAQKSRLLGA